MRKTASPPVTEPAPPAVVGAALRWGAARLAPQSPSPMLDARALMLDCLGFDEYAALLAHEKSPLPAAAARRYEAYIGERITGRPVAYILGWREFYSRRFKTTPAALIPRPDTETLVEAALWHVPQTAPARVLDLGTGCGAIGIVLALQRGASLVTLSDVSAASIALAKENAILHKADNVRFACGDWYQALESESGFDLIVSNPPYVAEGDAHLTRGDLRFEPPLALVAGADGLVALAQVIGSAPAALRRGGVLLVEHADAQAPAVRRLFAAAGFCGLHTLTDLAGQRRVTLAVLP